MTKKKKPSRTVDSKFSEKPLQDQRAMVANGMAEIYERGGEEVSEQERPIIAWQAWWFLRQCGKPLPEWVLEYFDQCAEEMMNLFDSPEPANFRLEVSKALGFAAAQDGPGVVAKYQKEQRNRDLVFWVIASQFTEGGSVKAAIKRTAEFRKISERKVRRAYAANPTAQKILISLFANRRARIAERSR